MSKDSMTRLVKNLERLFLMAGKKRHFVFINVAYFNRFNEYIVWQRPNGMVHLYQSGKEARPTMCYIRKKKLEKLWMNWKRKKSRDYFRYCDKWRGNFTDILNPEAQGNVLSEFNLEEYEKAKDIAIGKVAVFEDKRDLRKIKGEWAKNAIVQIEKLKLKLKQGEIGLILGYSRPQINAFAKEIKEMSSVKSQNIITNTPNVEQNSEEAEEEEENII